MTADVQFTSTQNSYTHQWLQSHNYYRCGILPSYYTVVIRVIIRYVVCGQVQIASNLLCLHALSSANDDAPWLLWLLWNVTMDPCAFTCGFIYYSALLRL